MLERHDIAILTGTGATATSYSGIANGSVMQIQILLPTSGQVVSTGVITVKGAVTNQTIWTKTATGSRTVAPRQPTLTAAGATFATAAGQPVASPFFVANEKIKVTVAGGGVAKTATIRIITSD
jgi:hypothetical protein